METSADEVDLDVKANVTTLEGNVTVTYDGKEFKAGKVTMEPGTEKPQKIIAVGNVSFEDAGITVTADKCIYDTEQVKFAGNVVIRNELGTIKADTATYNLKTKKVEIASNNRVELVLNPDKEKKFCKVR
jgi:lipopolysaccharide transport protein LptA